MDFSRLLELIICARFVLDFPLLRLCLTVARFVDNWNQRENFFANSLCEFLVSSARTSVLRFLLILRLAHTQTVMLLNGSNRVCVCSCGVRAFGVRMHIVAIIVVLHARDSHFDDVRHHSQQQPHQQQQHSKTTTAFALNQAEYNNLYTRLWSFCRVASFKVLALLIIRVAKLLCGCQFVALLSCALFSIYPRSFSAVPYKLLLSLTVSSLVWKIFPYIVERVGKPFAAAFYLPLTYFFFVCLGFYFEALVLSSLNYLLVFLLAYLYFLAPVVKSQLERINKINCFLKGFLCL